MTRRGGGDPVLFFFDGLFGDAFQDGEDADNRPLYFDRFLGEHTGDEGIETAVGEGGEAFFTGDKFGLRREVAGQSKYFVFFKSQRFGDALEDVGGGKAFASFDTAKMRSGHPGFRGQFLERKRQRDALLFDDLPQVSLRFSFHRGHYKLVIWQMSREIAHQKVSRRGQSRPNEDETAPETGKMRTAYSHQAQTMPQSR